MFLSAARTVPGTFFNGSVVFFNFLFSGIPCRFLLLGFWTKLTLTASFTLLVSVTDNRLDDEAKAKLTEAANARGVALDL